MKIALIVNPSSGKKKAHRLIPQVTTALTDASIKYHLHISNSPGHLEQLVSRLSIDFYDAVISMGGDGTNFQVINALLNTFKPEQIPPIGLIPAGSGNSFAMDLNIQTIPDAVSVIRKNTPKAVDVCSFSQEHPDGCNIYYFVNLTGVGFVTDVAKTADRFKWLGEISYLIGVFFRGIFFKHHDTELIIDGKKITGKKLFIEICNSRYTGGNMMMAPTARIDDGLMDVVVAGRFSRFNLFKTLPLIFSGRHLEHPQVELYKAKTVELKTRPSKSMLPDGEIFGTTPALFNIHPGLVRYLQ